ncbi:MAG: HdeD family acid-resistance protein [Pseudomonadales bacterium]|jgi:uncharacterized membrane protein HdeD (DUF308 family)
MSEKTPMGGGPSGVAAQLIDTIRHNAGTAVAMGVIMLIAGILALIAPAVAGLSIAILVGFALAISGISQCVLAFKAGAFGRGLVMFVVGVLMVIAGFFMIGQPLEGLLSLTLLLTAYLVATGILEIIVAFQLRPAQGWGLQLANGIITLLLGALLWAQFPLSGVWAVGIIFGVKMIFSGAALIAIGRSVRKGAEAASG